MQQQRIQSANSLCGCSFVTAALPLPVPLRPQFRDCSFAFACAFASAALTAALPSQVLLWLQLCSCGGAAPATGSCCRNEARHKQQHELCALAGKHKHSQ